MEAYFHWKFIREMIGLGILGLIFLGYGSLWLYIVICDWLEIRRKNRKGAGK